MASYVFDVEADGLLDTVAAVWSIVLKNIDTKEVHSYHGPTLTEGINKIQEAEVLVGHNIICYDVPVLEKVFGVKIRAKLLDTLLLSRMIWPEIGMTADIKKKYHIPGELFGSYSLEAFGYRVGLPIKVENEDWSRWTPNMQKRCEHDVEINFKLWELVEKKLPPEKAIYIETEFQKFIHLQETLGVYFDVEKALALQAPLKNRIHTITKDLQGIIPRKEIKLKTKVKYEDFNPGSRQQIIEFLCRKYDWRPTVFTENGNPKLSEDVLESLPFPEAKLFAEYFKTQKLLGMISEGENSWLNFVKDGKIHGRVVTLGAVTGRCTHSSPNLAQIPSVRSFMGKEVRSLFYAPAGYNMIGTDASGLELRCFSHYLSAYDYGAYANEVVHGDVHTRNMYAAGLDNRDDAKKFIYACVTMDTQCLTKEGWKLYHELKEGELVLTYNAEKNQKEWKPILEKVCYESAPVIEMIHSHSFKIKTTPNHRWFVRQRRVIDTAKRTNSRRFTKRYMMDEVRTTEDINSESNIITNAPMKEDKLSSFSFTQGKYDRDWVKLVLSMSSKERKAFLQGFLLADGYKNNAGKNSWVWNQNVNEISEGLLLCSFLEAGSHIYARRYENKANKREMIHVNISTKSHITGQKLRKKEIGEQPVWCIRTENESFVIRQGDCITITGNTLYGAGDEKLGSIVNKGRAAGLKMRHSFMDKVPAYGQLTKDIQLKLKLNPYLKGIDGRTLTIRHNHAALNTLLQNAGAVAMKLAAVIFAKDLESSGIPVLPCLNVHDEFEVYGSEKDSEQISKIAIDSIRKAGEELNFKCPLTGESKIGKDWSEVH